MSDFFPVPIPDRLPVRIDPCPIVEAVMEIRFVTSEPWSVLPGLLFSRIRERYPTQRDLPLLQLPEEFRRKDPALTHLPLAQFLGDLFTIQFGPRVLSLTTQRDRYPGWGVIESEIAWLIEQTREVGFITEAERLATRYIDFFPGDIFPHLILGAHIDSQPLQARELSINTVFRRSPFTARLQILNNALVGGSQEKKLGSVLDLDVWAGALDFDLYENGRTRFAEAHTLVKQTFFGLLRPDFLDSLNPHYE